MSILEIILTVYASLTRHFIRAFLAMLGIVLGIAAVVAMLAISEGGKRGVIDQIKAQGIGNIIIKSIRPTTSAAGATASSAGGIERGARVVSPPTTFRNPFFTSIASDGLKIRASFDA